MASFTTGDNTMSESKVNSTSKAKITGRTKKKALLRKKPKPFSIRGLGTKLGPA